MGFGMYPHDPAVPCNYRCGFSRYEAGYILGAMRSMGTWARLAEDGTHEIRSRSDCGGSLVLYRRMAVGSGPDQSPTGVRSEGSVPDCPETREALRAAGCQVFMGAC